MDYHGFNSSNALLFGMHLQDVLIETWGQLQIAPCFEANLDTTPKP